MTAVRQPSPALALVFAFFLTLTGCAAAMDNTDARARSNERLVADAGWPMKFKGHYFDAYCFSTYGCKVYYHGMLRVDDPDDQLRVSSDTLGEKYPEILSAGMGPIGNFPPPAKVIWRSKDGAPHETEIDIGEIFKDEVIRHNVPRQDVTDNTLASDLAPGIILEVNDRTINVYMRVMISTKELQVPGNRYSGFRDDIIKVFSRTY